MRVRSLLIFVILSVLNGCSSLSTNKEQNYLSFQEFDPFFQAMIDEEPFYLPDGWKERFTLAPPPLNDSEDTKHDLQILHQFEIHRRTPEFKQLFIAEICLCGHKFAGISAADAYNIAGIDRSLYKVFVRINADASRISYFFKKKYLRARPSFLDPSLSTAIKVPYSPSYPSGHSTITHTIALALQKIEDDPLVREQIALSADQISERREIGGLYFPSDTEAGKVLAKQIFNVLLENPRFVELLEKAKPLWKYLRKELKIEDIPKAVDLSIGRDEAPCI